MRPLNYLVFSAADVTSNQNGAAIEADFVLSVSAQAELTGTNPNGTLKLQASNDNVFAPVAPSNWSDIGTPLAISATGTYLLPALDVCYKYLRLVWVKNTGTGTITARIKTVGF